MDAMDLEDPGSARGTKRSNSFNSLLAWEAAGTGNTSSAPVATGPATAGAGAGACAIASSGFMSDMHRTASAPQSLSRFSFGAGGGCVSRSLSPSPTPTPIKRGERASPAKTPERAHSTMAAFELVQATSGSSGSGGGSNAQAVYKGVSKHK